MAMTGKTKDGEWARWEPKYDRPAWLRYLRRLFKKTG
jgi:hypothetical protein